MGNGIRFDVWILAGLAGIILSGCNSSGVVSNTPSSGYPGSSPTTAAGEWTWVSGSKMVNQKGIYGTLGAASAGNLPGARMGSVSWTDDSGALWLFGGAAAPVGGGCRLLDPLCWAGTNSYFNDLWKFSGDEWAWMGGSNNTDEVGRYGTQGIAAADNVPGARYDAASWRDSAGSLWLFGGTGYDSEGNIGVLNDLWKYSGGEWTWVSGAKTINQAGSYGTEGAAAAGNFPGARSGAISLADAAGNFWLFGGVGCDSVGVACGFYLNDLWEYSGGRWTWVSGFSTAYPTQPGVYGTRGTPAASNHPGGRINAAGWMDPSGNLWIFGGVGWGSWSGNVAELSDLWKYSGGQWTWVSGPDESYANINQLGSYGTQGTAAPANSPGSRDSAVSWTDGAGNLWLFGGQGFGATNLSAAPELSDLWKFSGGQWTWVGGSNTGGQVGVFGTQGSPASSNVAGARMGAVSWIDADGHLWLFGGIGIGSSSGAGYLNDLWEYQP